MKFNSLVVLLLTLAGSGTVFGAVDRERSQRDYEKALEYIRASSFDEATIELRNAVQADGDNLAARIMLGRLLLQRDEPLAAIKELEKAQAMGGDENLILVPLATAYMEIAEPGHVITGFVAEGHEPEVDGELQIIQAQAAMQLGDLKRAETLFLEAGTLLPTDPRPLTGRARIWLSKGKPKKAVQLVEDAVALAPESFEARLFKATFYRDIHDYETAITAFEEALSLNPTSGRALTARAALWLDVGETEKAKADLLQVKNLNSDTLETIYLRTLIMFREGRADEAREALRANADQLREIRDDVRKRLPNTTLMLGVVAFFEQRYDESIVLLKTFLAIVPNHPGAKRYLAAAYLAVGDHKQVVKLFKPSPRSTPPRDPMALSILAEAYRGLGDYKATQQYLRAALALAPDQAGIGIRLAMSQLDAGNADKAVADLEALTELLPEMRDAWLQLARVLSKTGKTERALEVVDSMLEKFNGDVAVHNFAAATLLSAGDMDRAEMQLKLAEELGPELLMPKLNRARLARIQGQSGSAEALYRVALERFPHSTEANLELSKLLIGSGEHEEALERITAVLTTEPTNFPAHELKLRLLLAQEDDLDRIRSAVYELTKAFPEAARADLVAGRSYRRLGDTEDAKVHFRRAVEKAHFDSDLLLQIANQQFGITDFKGALWSLTKAEQGGGRPREVGVLMAAVLTELGEYDKARKTVERLEESHGESADILLVNGDLLMKTGERDTAAIQYQRAFELAPSERTAKVYFRGLVAAEEIDAAEAHMADWIGTHPDDLGARHLYAQMLVKEKRWADAQQVYEALQSAGVEDIVLLNNLATCYQHLGDPRALPIAEAAHALAPGDPKIADTYGWILTENGRTEEGLALLREAYARASTSPAIRYHIGLALSRLGRNAEAQEELEAALATGERFSAQDDASNLLEQLKSAIR